MRKFQVTKDGIVVGEIEAPDLDSARQMLEEHCRRIRRPFTEFDVRPPPRELN